jgi:hypothetical protein
VDIEFSPDYQRDRTVFAATPFDGVYKTTNGAMTPWTKVEDRRAHSLAISPNFSSDKTIYLGKSDGVKVSADGGSRWVTTDVSFTHRVDSLSIAVMEPRLLYAGTFDKGVWAYEVVQPTATPTLSVTATSTLTATPEITATDEATATPTAEATDTPSPETHVYLPITVNKEDFD